MVEHQSIIARQNEYERRISSAKHADGDIRRAEKEEEKGERRARFGRGAVETRTDQVMDRVGRASQGCVRLARLVEIEYGTDRWFFAKANTESQDVLKYAGVKVSGLDWGVHECSSISTLEMDVE